MKIERDCSIHLAIGAVLKGDHAIVEKVKLLAPQIIDKPDYQSKLQNALRFEVFQSGRSWIAKNLTFDTGMTIVCIGPEEIAKLRSPFDSFTMEAFARAYAKAHRAKTGFKFKGITKTKSDVKHVFKMVTHLEKYGLFPRMNDALIMDDQVMDGTHRLLAYCWATRIRKAKLPKIDAFHWKST